MIVTGSVLDKIVASKQIEVETAKREIPLSALKEKMRARKPRDFKSAITGKNIRLIAEVKKASPSRGLLRADFNPVTLAEAYELGGAAAISVLTESQYFQGKLEYLAGIRKAVSLPLLRKDFIFDPYQVFEAAAGGADAILLITAILEINELKELLSTSKDCGLDSLVEVHNESEIETALNCGAQIIGINNRNLKNLTVDTATVPALRVLIPPHVIVVAESGLKTAQDIRNLNELGVNAALIGETLVTAGDISTKIKELGFVAR